MLKTAMVGMLLFLGVLAGMQMAGSGMKSLQGYDDPDLKSAFTVKAGENKEVEASILGQSVSSHDFEKKKEQLESMDAFNPLSEAAKGLAASIEALFGKVISYFKNAQ